MSTVDHGDVGTWRVRRIVRTMAPLLVVLSAMEMGSGFVLESLGETYLDNPTLLMLVPVMIGMGGNLGAIVAARLSTQLHLGTLSFDVRSRSLMVPLGAVLALAGTVFSVLPVVVYAFGQVTGDPMGLRKLATISLVSGMTLAVIAFLLAVAATYVSYRREYDPDDVTIPVVTNLCDVLGVVILSAVAAAVV